MIFERYLNPKTDMVFKKVFGEEKNKKIPISFLNAVFGFTGEQTIIDLKFLDTKLMPNDDDEKNCIVDVMVEDQRGEKFIIEMQKANIAGFEKRVQIYGSRVYCANFRAKEKYKFLKKVALLAITDCVIFPTRW